MKKLNISKNIKIMIGVGVFVSSAAIATGLIVGLTYKNKNADAVEQDGEKIALEKTNAKKVITDLVSAVSRDDATHDALLWTSLKEVESTALFEIDNAADIDGINSTLSVQKILVKSAITKYNNSTGSDKEFDDAKLDSRKTIIDLFDEVTRDDSAHDSSLWMNLVAVKNNALSEIDNAVDIDGLVIILNNQFPLVQNAIDDYKNSTGTN